MFSSFFSTVAPVDPTAQNFHPVSSAFEPAQLYGELEPKDLEWTCPGGFAVETQTFYNILEDGTSIMYQIIHSSVGVWYPTIQFTCKIYNPNTKKRTWKSINVTNFITPPPGLDKRSSKADEFSLTFKPSPPGSDIPDAYVLRANLGDDLQLSFEVTRDIGVPGFKVGKGPKGGYSYFGADPANAEGYVVHRFWPRNRVKGLIVLEGQAITAEGPGMFIHAIQGMRPNLVAARWNFIHFTSNLHGGVSAMQMDFTTINDYGEKGSGSGFVTTSVGSVVLGGKLVAVTAETKWPDKPYPTEPAVASRAIHSKTELDPDTTYDAPTEIEFSWAGPSILPDAPGQVEASIKGEYGSPDKPRGLIEKIDILAEIPYVIKSLVNYVSGTKPFMYQWVNPGTLSVKGPDAVLPGLSGGLEIEGTLYNEATFIS